MAKYKLTKSNLLYYRQCPKRLFLSAHRPELAEFDPNKAMIFDQGHLVGEIARRLHLGGEMVQFDGDPDPAVAQTERLLKESNKPIYEATFLHDEVLVRADLLFPSEHGLRVVEVKQSTSVKAVYRDDCAVQAWVIGRAGHRVESFAVAHINNKFVYPGNENYDGLFTEVPMDDHVRALESAVPTWVEQAKEVVDSRREPVAKMGKQCKDPYDCPFLGYCSLEEPEHSVKKLPHGGKLIAELEAQGYTDLRDVPEDLLTKPVHARMRRAVISGRAELAAEARATVRALAYPRYYLDFETINFAVPIWKSIRPYQQIAFQWSCHVQHENGTLTHSAFLDTSGEFPARSSVDQLLDALGTSGPIISYSTFEKTTLTQLAELYPDLEKRINAVIERIFDLLPVLRDHYYHPRMAGSWSLKKVLPTLVPNLDYSTCGEVADGGGAQRAYIELIKPDTDAARRDHLKAALEKYCGLDTLAMVRVVEALSFITIIAGDLILVSFAPAQFKRRK